MKDLELDRENFEHAIELHVKAKEEFEKERDRHRTEVEDLNQRNIGLSEEHTELKNVSYCIFRTCQKSATRSLTLRIIITDSLLEDRKELEREKNSLQRSMDELEQARFDLEGQKSALDENINCVCYFTEA